MEWRWTSDNGQTKTKEEVIDALHGVASEMHDKMMKGNPYYDPASEIEIKHRIRQEAWSLQVREEEDG